MTRVVLDANVLVSALISPGGTPARILELWREDEFVLLVSESILGELERVLIQARLRRYGLTAARAARLLRGLRQFAIVVNEGPEIEDNIRDPDDRKFLACARAGRADYVVTGDEDLLSLGECGCTPIVSPADFVRLMGEE
jgi:putative PIN family toxin of toxin-antitoxin system